VPIYDETINYRVTGVYASVNVKNATAYFTTPESVMRINPDGGFDAHTSDKEVLAVIPTAKGALVCGENAAYPIFDE